MGARHRFDAARDQVARGQDEVLSLIHISLNDQGADVIFQIASACGDGVFEAAKEKGFYAIGVDSDQKLSLIPISYNRRP